MKIVIDARLYGLENAGLGRYTINLLDELKKLDKNNEYTVLLREKYFNRLKFPKNWKKILADFRHYTLTEQVKLPKILSNEKPDLVHFLHMNVPIFYRGKFIVTVHDLLMQRHRGAEATTLPIYEYLPKLLGAKLVFKNAVKRSIKIIVPSQAIKDEVVNFYHVNPDKITVIYEGVDIKIKNQKSKIKIKQPYFVYVGNAYPHKNLERAIEAAIAKKVLLVIVSSRNVFTKKLGGVVARLKGEKYIKLLGFVPDDELGILYKNSLGFIYPSLSEGFGLPGLEAFAWGTVCLASDIPVFKEIYKNVPIYFDPYKVDSIKKAIERVMNMQPLEREDLVKEGQELVKTYSWSKMAKQTLNLYEDSNRLRSGK